MRKQKSYGSDLFKLIRILKYCNLQWLTAHQWSSDPNANKDSLNMNSEMNVT